MNLERLGIGHALRVDGSERLRFEEEAVVEARWTGIDAQSHERILGPRVRNSMGNATSAAALSQRSRKKASMALDELYREVILDHYRNPRRKGTLDGDHIHAEGQNPSCGDEFSLDLRIEEGVVVDAAIQGIGCSISQASGSMMAEALIGKSLEEVSEMTGLFKQMMGIDEGDNPVDPNRPGAVLGDLEALQGVRKFPVRVKCADLPWTTLESAVQSLEATTG